MAVSVRLPTVLRPHAGGASTVAVEGATVGEVVKDLASRFPAMAPNLFDDGGSLQRFVNLYVNDEDIRYLDKLDTPVTDRDEVTILPAVAGGSI
ncbi:MAG: MoaD/ThiS family protein [Acidimicrobiia bacterium]|nr:MoaD/ThiS family protein [Acidimicrobiia bacterium]